MAQPRTSQTAIYIDAESGAVVAEIAYMPHIGETGIQHLPTMPQEYRCMFCGEGYTEHPGFCVCTSCRSIYALPL